MRLCLRYEVRSAPGLGAPLEDLYGAALEQCAWADGRGWHGVRLAEHHASEDGYLPSPLVLAGAIAARTQTLRIRVAVLVLSLHDPMRVAEDAAVVDLISRGRLEIVAAAGYRPEEFALFGKDLRNRPRLIEEGFATLRAAWSGERVERNGFSLHVTPRPLQRPGPPLLLGGSSEAAARRAARIADGWDSDRQVLGDAYRDECDRSGNPPGVIAVPPLPAEWLHVTLDPERDLQVVGPYIAHEINVYGQWLGLGPGDLFPTGIFGTREDAALAYPIVDVSDLQHAEGVKIVTPDECLAFIRRHHARESELRFRPLVGGLPPEHGWSSLELFAGEVLPTLLDEQLVTLP